MAQTGYTPISIYYSSTAGNTPTAGNLVAGELAINTADGKLFYKDSAGVVQVIAGKGGAGVAGGSNTQVQYNSSGSLAGSANMTFDGTNLTVLGSISTTISSKTAQFNAAGGSIYSSYADGTKTWRVGSGIQSAGLFSIYNATDAVTPLNITSTGYVGIGITSPKTYLQIDGSNVSGRGQLSLNGGLNSVTQLSLYNGDTSLTNLTGQLYTLGDNISIHLSAYQSTGYIAFETNGNTERMRVSSAGNVSIGTTAQVQALTVNGGIAAYGSSGLLSIYRRDNNAYAAGMYSTAGGMAWDLANIGTAMVLDSNANLNIGLSSGSFRLNISDSTSATRMYIQNTANAAGGSGIYMQVFNGASVVADNTIVSDNSGNMKFFTGTSSGSERMRIGSNGAVNIGGTTTGGYGERLMVQSAGSAQASLMLLNPGIGSGQIGFTAASPVLRIRNSYADGLLTGDKGIDIDTAGNFGMNSGYGSVATAYGCRVWVNFQDTGSGITIRGSGNVSGVTRYGAGNYGIGFTNGLPDANYAAVVSGSAGDGVSTSAFVNGVNNGTTGCQINANAATTYCMVALFR